MKLSRILLLWTLLAFGAVNTAFADQTVESSAAVAVVNINTANVEQLTELKGIGKKKAQLIVEYREKYGPFKASDEIGDVKGIGKSTFQANAHRISVE